MVTRGRARGHNVWLGSAIGVLFVSTCSDARMCTLLLLTIGQWLMQVRQLPDRTDRGDAAEGRRSIFLFDS
ncbi:hypothetical protein ACO34A_04355 [Rhizobium sp. ACO-34A]|nr:hypothetical protein ACO34A_04355 [Rhizobium sp. ACO-34A]